MQILKDEIRILILQAAEKLFCENGFLKTTTRGIAKEAGISVSNLYLYYENKEMLFNAVSEPIFQQLISGLVDFLNHQDKTEALNQNITFGLGKMIVANRDQFLLLFEKSKGTKYESFQDEMITQLQSHIRAQMNEKVKDKDLISSVFAMNLIKGIVHIAKAHRDETHLIQNLQHLTDFHTEGIRQFLL
ncbi:TetR/AcrR family transcriptional regulator [Fusibacter sp. 3D3]|uniref:TetR/AcrR family transcriptional regulator n=1 Tax=Fusibacter sp. 3D3 TaxID=1048380 RepID=UPI000853C5CB|nr:TetR/AcrR family transcriptional regulator [Fusibacter sp. 3D3]GAU75992.1 transcriptional regulator [Fusibacter sp. 3D3]